MNRVALVGRVTKDIEIRKTQSGVSVARFSLAVNVRRKGENTAEFFNCQAWKGTADFLGKYVRKGALVSIDGRLHQNVFTDKFGKRVEQVIVLVDNVEILKWPKEQEPRNDQENQEADNQFDTGSGYFVTTDDLPF